MAGPSRRPEVDDEPDPYANVDPQLALDILHSRIAELTGFASMIANNRDSDSDPDRRMAQSIAAAVLNDGPLIADHDREENIASHDHNLARRADAQIREKQRRGDRNADMDPLTENDLPQVRTITENELVLLSKLAGLHVSESAARALMPDNILNAEFRAHGQGPLRATHACTACTDSKTWIEIYTAPCNHEYCGGCLFVLFRDSYKDESLFPPRCCQQTIPFNDKILSLFLPKSILDRYPSRKVEVETTDRTYCHQCEKFIMPSAIANSVATCDACRATTCIRCKRARHAGACSRDEAEQQVIELAEREGWKRCPGCRAMVELDYGCNHMTCRCGFQFCYICTARWKTCRCVRYTEERLMRRAAQIVNRDANQPRNAAARDARIRQVAQHQEANHECNHPHHGWRRINGRNRCEECRHMLPEYIFECGQCQLRACWRCRCNRL